MFSAEPVCSCAHFLVHIAHETAGAARARLSLRPLFSEGGSEQQTSGELRRENAKACMLGRTQPYQRRPGLEPGPIRRGLSVSALALDTFCRHERRGVWVPAPDAQLRIWAGTTS